MPSLIDRPYPLVLAHRGDSRAAPENTLPAFLSALKLGVDLVELDYHHSADGVPVVFHDEELDRATDARRRWGGKNILLANCDWSDLRQLDAGRWFGESFAGTRLSRLEDALGVICPQAGCMIERKSGDAKALVALLAGLGYVDRCVVMAFEWSFLADCRSLCPDMALGALGSDPLTEDRLVEARRIGARVIGWDDQFVTAEQIERIHAHGLKAWIWTVDQAERAGELLSWGVDGLISNVPGVMQTVVARHGGQRAALPQEDANKQGAGGENQRR